MFDCRENYIIARNLAAQGMVLLKNEEHTLPFLSTDNVGIIGRECLDIIKGGGGSGKVKCEYVRSLVYGLQEKARDRKVSLNDESVRIAETHVKYDVSILNQIARVSEKCIVTYQRFGQENADRQAKILNREAAPWERAGLNRVCCLISMVTF